MTSDEILSELEERLFRARDVLADLALQARERAAQAGTDWGGEVYRLNGKVEGVELALSYMREYKPKPDFMEIGLSHMYGDHE